MKRKLVSWKKRHSIKKYKPKKAIKLKKTKHIYSSNHQFNAKRKRRRFDSKAFWGFLHHVVISNEILHLLGALLTLLLGLLGLLND